MSSFEVVLLILEGYSNMKSTFIFRDNEQFPAHVDVAALSLPYECVKHQHYVPAFVYSRQYGG